MTLPNIWKTFLKARVFQKDKKSPRQDPSEYQDAAQKHDPHMLRVDMANISSVLSRTHSDLQGSNLLQQFDQKTLETHHQHLFISVVPRPHLE